MIEREPQTDPTPNLALGKQYLRAGNYKEADEQLSRALEKDPNFGEAWFWKGITAICQHGPNRRDWGLALSYLQKAAILDSQIVEMLASVLAGDSQWLSVSQFFTTTNRTVAIDVLKYAPNKDALWLACLFELAQNDCKLAVDMMRLSKDWAQGLIYALGKDEEFALCVFRSFPDISLPGGDWILNYLARTRERLLLEKHELIRNWSRGKLGGDLDMGLSKELEPVRNSFLTQYEMSFELIRYVVQRLHAEDVGFRFRVNSYLKELEDIEGAWQKKGWF